MKHPLRWISLMAALSTPTFASGEKVDEIETIPVPATLLKEASEGRLVSVRVHPGVNTVIPIATGHLNRLILPFDEPSIRTVNPTTTQLEGHVLYVAPSDENPITIYVTPGATEEMALSLTLAPQKIPPREVHLTLNGDISQKLHRLETNPPVSGAVGDTRPEHQSQDYIAELKGLFRSLALGQTPQGFNLRTAESDEYLNCQQQGLRVRVGQVLEGRDLKVLVGVAKNQGSTAIELREQACAGRSDVVAVAAWPTLSLPTGRSSELYVAVQKPKATETTPRPSLIGEWP